MNIFDAVVLGLVQGLTEFLPVSSSGHLILGESLLGLDVAGLVVFDIAVHFGTLLAILVYFRMDFWRLIVAFVSFFGGVKEMGGVSRDEIETNRKLVVYLVLATLPAIAVGLVAADWLEAQFRSPGTVAVMMLVVAAYFVLAEWGGKRLGKSGAKIGLWKALGIGVSQSFALIPGVSRSGSTISTGILLGMERREAARFSFLLGSIAIMAATALSIYKSLKGEMILPSYDILLAGVATAGLSGYGAIAFMLSYLRKHSLYVFAGYLVVIALITLKVNL